MTSPARTAAQRNWDDAGDRLRALAMKLDLHYRERASDDPGTGAGLARLGRAIEDAFEAFGDAVGDTAVRSDARDVGRSVVDAVNATLVEVSDVVRDRLPRR